MSEETVEATEERDFVTQEDVEAAEAPARPEWLPEKFKTPEDLAKSYSELQSKLGAKDEDLRKLIIEEIQNEAFADRPENVGDYKLPDSIESEDAVDNELLKWWSEHSFENGFSQEEFEQGIEMYAQAVLGSEPDLEAEAEKLGENANARIEAASVFANKFFPEESLPAIERMCESHEGILALEAIMSAMKDGNFSGEAQPTGGLSEPELIEMMNDPRYNDVRYHDRNFIKRVNDGWEALYRD